jgi:WGR domain
VSECSILLEAVNPRKNVFRSYYISAAYDLFDRLTVEVIHGRIGSKGKRILIEVANEGEAKELIATLLDKRKSSEKRCGVAYKLRQKTGHWDLDDCLFFFRQCSLFEEESLEDIKKPLKRRLFDNYEQGLLYLI